MPTDAEREALAERLDAEAANWSATCGDLFAEARDEITRLRAERDEWEADANRRSEWHQDACEEVDRLSTALAAVEAERDALRGALAEAADDIEAWGAYASAYFQSKHGLLDCIAKYRALTQEKPA